MSENDISKAIRLLASGFAGVPPENIKAAALIIDFVDKDGTKNLNRAACGEPFHIYGMLDFDKRRLFMQLGEGIENERRKKKEDISVQNDSYTGESGEV